MEKLATDFGLVGDGVTCNAKALESLLSAASDGDEIVFPAGQYLLRSCVSVSGKKKLVLRGENATILTHFTPDGDPHENNNAFSFSHCEDLTVRDFTFTTDAPTSCAGVVTAVDTAARTYDVRIDDAFPVTGWEHLWGCNTCDPEGSPDYVIATYDPIKQETVRDENGNERLKITGVPYEVVGDHVIRAKAPEYCDLSRLTIGHRILYRYIIYGNTVFGFSDCRRVTLFHIEIERCASMGAVISPRCADFTFDAFCMRMKVGDPALFCANADGIHVVGLEGYLRMKNCYFNGLGDDALNIHSQAGEISAIDAAARTVSCIYRNRQMEPGRLSLKWADVGDRIAFYDHTSFRKKGSFHIDRYQDGEADISDIIGSPAVGDILANESFFASVLLENCEVRNTRARGFLLQSKNMTLKNCRVYGTSLPAVLISPDVRVWYEVGPSENVKITGCTFEKCCFIDSAACIGAVVVKASHDGGVSDYESGVHRNIRMTGNTFRDIPVPGVCICAAEGVELYDNCFIRCGKYHMETHNCTRVTAEYNSTDSTEQKLFRNY